MVRMGALVLVLAVSAALMGCGGDGGSEQAADRAEATPEGAAGQATGPGEAGRSGDGAGAREGERPAEADRDDQGGRDAASGIRIKAGGSQFGTVLWSAGDRAIYVFDKEEGPQSECYGACAEAWPPVLTEGKPVAVRGADQALLGTAERRGGATQVTYNGQPLYYYVDEPRGEVLCHNVEGFGGLWLVVRPDGRPVS